MPDDASPQVARAIAAAQAPAFRVWTEGDAPAVVALGDEQDTLLVDGPGAPERGTFAVATAELPLALFRLLTLGPRPWPDFDPLELPAGVAAVVLGRAQAHGQGLPGSQATGLQAYLDAPRRHWSVRLRRPSQPGEVRRNVEVIDGEAGLLRILPIDAGARLSLRPTCATEVLRALVALVAAGTAGRAHP